MFYSYILYVIVRFSLVQMPNVYTIFNVINRKIGEQSMTLRIEFENRLLSMFGSYFGASEQWLWLEAIQNVNRCFILVKLFSNSKTQTKWEMNYWLAKWIHKRCNRLILLIWGKLSTTKNWDNINNRFALHLFRQKLFPIFIRF